MAQETLGANYPTLMDVASRLDPNGKIATIVEMLKQTNPILEDMVAIQANDTKVHTSTIRTGLPSATWRQFYGSVAPSKSKTAQVKDTIGMLEAYAEVDKRMAEQSGDMNGFRLSESLAFLESMNQTMATTLFYGSEAVYPERFNGLAPRYATYSTTETNIGFNIVPYHDESAGSGSDIYDMFLVVWGPNTIHALYPKGSAAGFRMEDKGQQTKETSTGLYEVMRAHYMWDLGLCVRDWRYGVRVCNVDLSDIAAETTTSALLDAMDKAYYKIPSFDMGRAAWYCPPAILPYLQKQAATRAAAALTLDFPSGKPVVRHLGVPIRPCQALVASSDEVTIS
jgi:hypothetical protein